MKSNRKYTALALGAFVFIVSTQVASAFYDPNLGRWINRDSLGEKGGVNLYELLSNDPLNLVDSDGERSYYRRPPPREDYRFPNGRPIHMLPPPNPYPRNSWPIGRRPFTCITIRIPGSNESGEEAVEEGILELILRGLFAPCPPPSPDTSCPAEVPSLVPGLSLAPGYHSSVNSPPNMGLVAPPPPRRVVMHPRNGGAIITAPGTIIWN